MPNVIYKLVFPKLYHIAQNFVGRNVWQIALWWKNIGRLAALHSKLIG